MQEKALARLRKKKEKEIDSRLASLTNNEQKPGDVKLEVHDKNVLGVKWVESKLSEKGQWPPKIPMLSKSDPNYLGEMRQNGELVDPIEGQEDVKKNLVMLTARLNSTLINSHPELGQAR